MNGEFHRLKSIKETNEAFDELKDQITILLSKCKKNSSNITTNLDTPSFYTDCESMKSEANSIVYQLQQFESVYQDTITDLKSQMKLLNRRKQRCNKVLDVPVQKFKKEIRHLEKLESGITNAESILNKEALMVFEEGNRKELEFLEEIEERNKKRQQLLQSNFTFSSGKLLNASSSESILLESTKTEFLFSNRSKCSIDDIKKQIKNLVGEVKLRQAKYKKDKHDLKQKEQEFLNIRSQLEIEFDKKEKLIELHHKSLKELEELRCQTLSVSNQILCDQQRLIVMNHEKEQIKRQNYTVARDKHNNSKSVKMLNQLKERVKETQKRLDKQKKDMQNRRNIMKEEEKVVNVRESEVNKKEEEVAVIEKQLEAYGINFSGKLSESQKELETLDFLAMAKLSKQKHQMTLEEELADLIITQAQDAP